MKRTNLDDRTADRLLAGAVTSEDAPPGYAGVADLLHSARPVPAVTELAGEASTVASMRAAILGHPVAVPTNRRKQVLAKILTTKAAAAAIAVALGGTGAAAATGSLPHSAQSTASDVLAKVGISVPSPNSHSNGHPGTRGQSGTHPTSDTGNGPSSHAYFGLCTASAASAGHPASTVTVFPSASTCSSVPQPGKPANPGSQGTANRPSSVPAGPPTSTPVGPPASTPAPSSTPVSTPNHGSAATGTSSSGTATGSAASGGANATGSSAAASGANNATDRSRP